MEVNESEFKDNMGRVALKIDRYKRNSDTSLWKYQYSCYTVSDKNMVERVEDNKRFIKFISYTVNTHLKVHAPILGGTLYRRIQP